MRAMLPAALLFLSGCACEVPFTATRDASIVIGTSTPASEGADVPGSVDRPIEDDVTVTLSQRLEAERRVIQSTWNGPLIDMGPLKRDAEEQVEPTGGTIHDVVIDALTIEVSKLQLEDLANNSVLDASAGLERFDARIGVQGLPNVVIATFDGSLPGATPDQPDISTDVDSALIDVVNRALHEGSEILGDAMIEVEQDRDAANPLSSASNPALVIELTLTITGTFRPL